jgi:hypothetical protein
MASSKPNVVFVLGGPGAGMSLLTVLFYFILFFFNQAKVHNAPVLPRSVVFVQRISTNKKYFLLIL